MKTFDEINARVAEIETRQSEIRAEMENPEADKLDALEEEARALLDERTQLDAELAQLKEEAAKAQETRNQVAEGVGTVTEEHEHQEEKKMSEMEIRNTKEYIDAFAEYIKTGNDTECRTLLSKNATAATGYVPVPELVDEIIRTAWESNEILNRVRKTYFRGNLKVPFEKSADDAYVHSEGTTGLTEEDLQLGIVTLTPANIKKWIKISDEAVALGGEAFVRYIYDEITYRVIKELSDQLVAKVVAAGGSNTTSAIGVATLTEAPGVNTIRDAAANLSEEATNLCVVLNRLTEVSINAAHAAANFAIDPFAGLPRIYTSALPAYSSASDNGIYMIVGDLAALQVNYPEGDGLVIKWDDLTYAEDDLVKVVGRQYAGYGITAPGRLVKVAKPAAAVTT